MISVAEINMSFEPVFLHLVNARFGDFYAGLWHLLSALEHLMPLIGFGLLLGQQSTKASRKSLLYLSLALLMGAFMGHLFPDLQLPVYINIASFIVIGGLVAINREINKWITFILAIVFGFTHGFGNGSAITEGMATYNFIIGVTLAGIIIVTLFAGLTLGLEQSWKKIAVRAGGSWIAAIGLIYIPMIFLDKT